MANKRVLAALAVLAFLAIAGLIFALIMDRQVDEISQKFCKPRERMLADLAQQGAQLRWQAKTVSGFLAEFYASADNQTWIFVRTKPGESTCIRQRGTEGWEILEPFHR